MANYKLLIKASAAKELKGVSSKKVRARLVERILALADMPRPHGCEKLSGQEKYKIRQGDYRVVYAVDDAEKTVLVVKVGHRKDVYR